jgi:hypothetical protein
MKMGLNGSNFAQKKVLKKLKNGQKTQVGK